MDRTTDFPIRPEWMYQVRSLSQAFLCKAWQGDRIQLEEALRWWCEAIPAAASIQEAETLKDLLRRGASDAARIVHQTYHEYAPRRQCADSPLDAVAGVWAQHHNDPRVTLRCWVEAFLQAFDAKHPSSVAERAAAILRARFANPPGLEALARACASSRAALTLDFTRRYGMSCGEYLTRVRLRWFIEAVRTSEAGLCRLAEAAGYHSYHNLVDALRKRTGLIPTEVRRLTDQEARELVDARLSLSGPVSSHCRSAFVNGDPSKTSKVASLARVHR